MDKPKAEDVTRRLVRFRNISVLFAWLVMPLPFVVHFSTEPYELARNVYESPTAQLIWVMILANVLAYVAVSLWTIQIAKQAFFEDNLKSNISDRFVKRPVFAKWWSAVQQTLQWNLLAGIPRVGLVLGITSIFMNYPDWYCQDFNQAKIFLQPYCPHNRYDSNFGLLVGVFTLLIFTSLNCGLLCALSHRHLLANPQVTVIRVFAKRLKIIVAFATIIFAFEFLFVMLLPLDGVGYDCTQKTTTPYGTCWGARRLSVTYQPLSSPFKSFTLVESLEVITWSLVDNGVMMTKNLMSTHSPISAIQIASAEIVSEHEKEAAVYKLKFFASQLLLAFISLSLMALQTYRYLRRMERNDAIIAIANARTPS